MVKPSNGVVKREYLLLSNLLDAYIVTYGQSSLSNVSGQWFNHAENLSLTYADRLISIDAYSNDDELYSLKFFYSNNKSIVHQLRNFTRLHPLVPSRLTFSEQNVSEITQCFQNTTLTTKSLVGLRFRFPGKALPLLGSCNGRIQQAEVYSDKILGYAQGKTEEFLRGFQFVWYQICSVRNEVKSCVDDDLYALDSKLFYTNWMIRILDQSRLCNIPWRSIDVALVFTVYATYDSFQWNGCSYC